jgi:hypothetical protein
MFLHEIINATCNKYFLIYKDKEEVKERVIYFFPTVDNVINIINYAKSEGADYICYRYNGPICDFMPVLSTEGFDCVAVINKDDYSDSLKAGSLKECVMNAIETEKETHRALKHRYHISPVKTLRITEEVDKYYANLNLKKPRQEKLVLVEGDCIRNEAREQSIKNILRFKGIIPFKD